MIHLSHAGPLPQERGGDQGPRRRQLQELRRAHVVLRLRQEQDLGRLQRQVQLHVGPQQAAAGQRLEAASSVQSYRGRRTVRVDVRPVCGHR